MAKAILVDTTKCTACRACQVACKQWNQLPATVTECDGTYENPLDFRGSYTRVLFNESVKDGEPRWNFAKTQCMHCTDAACAMVCPTGAIHKSQYGTTVIDAGKCIGCNYCLANCTFGVIYFDRALNRARKCDMCYERMANNLTPACAKACLAGCLHYGERSEVLAKAETAVSAAKGRGLASARVYGKDEVGGLGWVYVLKDAPAAYRLPADPDAPATARLWKALFQPARIVAGLAILFGLWNNRKYSADLAPAPEGTGAGAGRAISAGE
jgi:formate dehydrogenase iron-sulfur subunit